MAPESLLVSDEADNTCEGFTEVSAGLEMISGCITVDSKGSGVISERIARPEVTAGLVVLCLRRTG